MYLSTVEEILNVLREQSHGTSIVFMQKDMFIEETRRLTNFKRAYGISFDMLRNKDKLLGISAVDGAILADIEGRCHCVGAILDGEAVMKGDAGRITITKPEIEAYGL